MLICTSYENYKLLTYGIENKHYKFDENGNFVDLLPKGKPADEFGLNMSFAAWMGALGFSRQWDKDYFEFADKAAAYSNEYTNKLYTYLPSQSKYWDELDKLQKEAYIKIITGEKPLDYFDEFVKQWRQNGGDKLVQEANEWYNSVNG